MAKGHNSKMICLEKVVAKERKAKPDQTPRHVVSQAGQDVTRRTDPFALITTSVIARMLDKALPARRADMSALRLAASIHISIVLLILIRTNNRLDRKSGQSFTA